MDNRVYDVEQHYTQSQLERSILLAVERAGKDLGRLNLDDLAPVDEFHIRGRDATKELAEEIDLDEEMHVLDVGCGLGGPSRRLASDFGCRVTGLDLTKEYCRTAEALSALMGLEDLVSYRVGNALDMPFENNSFDVVWTQHASMNIGDKKQLYSEMHRVLRPGGHLAIYDIIAGPGGEVHFPVPWARDSSISFLATDDELRWLLENAGFTIESWRDSTHVGRVWFEAMAARIEREGKPRLGYHILLGDAFPEMVRNQIRNLEENRIGLLQVVAMRPVV